MIREQQIQLWEAISRYVRACGGDPDNGRGMESRFDTVVAIENAVGQIELELKNRLREADKLLRAASERADRSARATALLSSTEQGKIAAIARAEAAEELARTFKSHLYEARRQLALEVIRPFSDVDQGWGGEQHVREASEWADRRWGKGTGAELFLGG